MMTALAIDEAQRAAAIEALQRVARRLNRDRFGQPGNVNDCGREIVHLERDLNQVALILLVALGGEAIERQPAFDRNDPADPNNPFRETLQGEQT